MLPCSMLATSSLSSPRTLRISSSVSEYLPSPKCEYLIMPSLSIRYFAGHDRFMNASQVS